MATLGQQRVQIQFGGQHGAIQIQAQAELLAYQRVNFAQDADRAPADLQPRGAARVEGVVLHRHETHVPADVQIAQHGFDHALEIEEVRQPRRAVTLPLGHIARPGQHDAQAAWLIRQG